MHFSFISNIRSRQALPCTRDVFYQLISNASVTERVNAYRAGNAKAKSELPAFLFHATFESEQRGDQWAVPSGLYMLDFDHLDQPNGVASIWSSMLGHIQSRGLTLDDVGILLVHVTPSGKGLRIVAMMKAGHPDNITIANWQQWLYEQIVPPELQQQLGEGLDTCVKDFARLSFIVPHSEFLYLDDSIFSREPEAVVKNFHYHEGMRDFPFEDAAATPCAAAATKEGSTAAAAPCAAVTAPAAGATPVPHAAALPAPPTDADSQLTYGGVPLSQIADAWLIVKGEPKVGERHTFYYQMASYFRYICDNNARAMYAQLPTFGLSDEERWKICDHTAKVKNGTKIPYDFYRFLVDNGYKEDPRKPVLEEADVIDDAPSDDPSQPLGLPPLPPLIKEFVACAPKDFKVPVIFALFPVLGTLATRLRAQYLDGEMHSPSATTVIYAPQSSGKSFVRRLDRALLGKLRERDAQSMIKERSYKEELSIKKNAKQLPQNPHAPYRIIPAVISVPQLLERQTDAQGLHQFTLLEELDTLTKSNKGGSWADKSDLYRVAYDNGYYGQDYKNAATFSGTVQLFYNLLMCGTPGQVRRFFADAENGLVSRVCFCQIKNQLFVDLPCWKPFTPKQLSVIEEIVGRLDALTYSEGDVVKGVTEVDMEWIFRPLHQWSMEKMQLAQKSANVGMDHFRRRAAVNAFRYALICTQLYPALTATSRHVIRDFALWFAEQDLQNRCELFADDMQLEEEKETKAFQQNLYDMMPEHFMREELKMKAQRLMIKSPERTIIYLWIKRGLIRREGDVFWKTQVTTSNSK